MAVFFLILCLAALAFVLFRPDGMGIDGVWNDGA